MEFEGRKRIATDLNIAPLVDVVFLLLIFFMLTSTLTTTKAVEVNLPKSSSTLQAEDTPLTVTIKSAEEILVNEQSGSLDELSALLTASAHGEDEKVVIRSEATVDVQILISVMDRLRAAGLVNISLATVE